MLMVRLQRVGRKNEPTFRIVVTDKQNSTKSGRFLEVVGNYDSRRSEKAEFDAEKIKHWISKGAKLSGTMHNLLISRKVITGKKINVLPKKKPVKKEESTKAEGGAKVPAPETVATPVAEAKPAEVPVVETPIAEAPKA